MNGEDQASSRIPLSKPSSPPSTTVRKDGSVGRSGYKIWVIAALLLLAFWSMFTGSVSLKWSNYLTRFSSDSADFSPLPDLDILELDQREKVVRSMWDVYTQKANAPLTRFWQEAFEAGYEFLSSDVPGVRDAAVSEIAKLSMYSDLLPTSTRQEERR